MNLKNSIIWFFGCMMISCAFGSCDKTIELLDKEIGIYSIYGILEFNEHILSAPTL